MDLSSEIYGLEVYFNCKKGLTNDAMQILAAAWGIKMDQIHQKKNQTMKICFYPNKQFLSFLLQKIEPL